MKLLNIGCGGHYHPSWTNIDVVARRPDVIACDLRKGLPFPDNSFDGVYHSHVIEHLSPDEALAFLKDGLRVLRTGGVMRIVTPDLEGIVRTYLDRLDAAIRGETGAADDHAWMVLELFDQMVREHTGGMMGAYLASGKNRDFVACRIGSEAYCYWDAPATKSTGMLSRVLTSGARDLITKIRRKIASQAVCLIAGRQAKQACDAGFFRSTGEIHKYLFDRYSLRRYMEQTGLVNIKHVRADESAIADFNSYQLDSVDGAVRKPDSLFMEGLKP